jgi:hypothetical protein
MFVNDKDSWASGYADLRLEIVCDSYLNSEAGAGCVATAEEAEGKLQSLREGIAAPDLTFQLAATQGEVFGHRPKQLSTQP